jgi:hypothetical protein
MVGLMPTIRVVQWTTGIVGASALRAILDDPRLELVGVFAHGAEKVGQDAGVLAGRAATGVIATADVRALIDLHPDCVVYMPHWPDVDLLVDLLEAGINVVTTARLVTGEHYPANAGARLRAAALAGGATLVGTGMNPMYVPAMALASTAMCRDVQRITIHESLDCMGYASASMWQGYGFGGPPDVDALHENFWRTEPDYQEALGEIARGIGLALDDVSLTVACGVALEDRDLGFMQISTGTVSGVDLVWSGSCRGSEIAVMRTTWTLGSALGFTQEPEWPILYGYKIKVEGDPNVSLKLAFRPADLATFDIGTTTSMPAINAVTRVVAAKPGIVSIFELPMVTARGRLS